MIQYGLLAVLLMLLIGLYVGSVVVLFQKKIPLSTSMVLSIIALYCSIKSLLLVVKEDKAEKVKISIKVGFLFHAFPIAYELVATNMSEAWVKLTKSVSDQTVQIRTLNNRRDSISLNAAKNVKQYSFIHV